jgi:hypothetical protein
MRFYSRPEVQLRRAVVSSNQGETISLQHRILLVKKYIVFLILTADRKVTFRNSMTTREAMYVCNIILRRVKKQ